MLNSRITFPFAEARLIGPWLLLSLLYLTGLKLSEQTEYLLFLGSMLFMGIPHGALDHLVEKQNKELKGKTFSLVQFLLQYVTRMVIFALIWYISPMLALLIFLAISAFHFGETDLYASTMSTFIYGMGLLFFLLITHIDTVLPIIKSIPSFDAINTSFFTENKLFLVLLCGFVPIAIILTSSNTIQIKLNLLLRTSIILLVIYLLPLLLAFTFYFGCWHSVRSLNFIRKHLSTPEHNMSWRDLAIKALPFSLVAVSFIVILIYVLYTYFGMSITLMSLFIGVAILTAPHLSVMSDMYTHVKKLKA